MTHTTVPNCSSLGSHCREIEVTLRVSDLDEDTPTLQDAVATWLFGHTERITFGRPYVVENDVLVDAVVHVPCKHLVTDTAGNGHPSERCRAHGFRGALPASRQPSEPGRFRRGDQFRVFFKRRERWLPLPLKKHSSRNALPVIVDNPCFGAPCRTADNKQGAACCRDLTLEIVLPRTATHTESLLRSRRAPYLCKVERTSDTDVECEVISACGHLGDDGVSCELHDRVLPNGRGAKPSICNDWPELDDDCTGHPGCAFL